MADDAGDLGRRAAGELIRPAAGEQFVQQHAERVDVGGGRDHLAADLFRAGVFRRHQREAVRRGRVRLAAKVGIEQLGDAEIEQLGRAVGGHQDVGGLDVAMDDQVLVRVLHRCADFREHLESRRGVQAARLAVLVDRLPLDELHREVGQAVGRGAAVEQAADVGMVEAGEYLALVAEAADDRVGVHAALEHFERDAFLEGVVAADGKVDGAHAAASQFPDEAIRTDSHAVDAAVLFGWAHGSEYKWGSDTGQTRV